jgi:hypothetical protein
MPKIIANKPQHLEDLQFRLEIGSMSITDELRVRSGNLVADLTASGLTSPFASFIFPEMAAGTFNIDLSEMPSTITELDVLVDAQVTSFRSWSLTGLSTGEFWQNDGIEIASGSSCLILSFSRAIDGLWSVTARNKFEGQESYGTENSNLPDDIRALAALANAHGLGKSASNFSIILDTTTSMQRYLDCEGMLDLVTIIRAISASKNNRAVGVSFGGSNTGLIGILDAANKKFLDLLVHSRSEEERQRTPPFSETVEKAVKASEPNSALYVISDSIPWIDVEEIAAELQEKDTYIFIVLISNNLGIDISSLPKQIVIINIPEDLCGDSGNSTNTSSPQLRDPKDLAKRFV